MVANNIPSIITWDISQRELFEDISRVIVVNWHRQKGKDFCAAGKAVDHAIRTGQDWYIVSLTQRQADATFAKCKRFANAFKHALKLQGKFTYEDQEFQEYDKEIDESFNYTARTIRLPNGGSITSLPGKDPDTLAGLTGNIILTEFGLFPKGGYDHWRVIFPLTTRGYQVIVISTPRSHNTKFFELCDDSETYSYHFCDIIQSVEQEDYVLEDNNGKPCTVEEFEKIYNDAGGWKREYLCQFTGDLEALITWARLQAAGELGRGREFSILQITDDGGWLPDGSFFDFMKDASGRFELGWDVARKGHLSAMWVNHAKPDDIKHLRALVIMRNTTFALQRKVVRCAMDGLQSNVGCGDSTGLGLDSNETLETEYEDRWQPVNFAGNRKGEIGSTLHTTFGDGGQTLPPMDGEYKYIGTDLYAIQVDRSGNKIKLIEDANPLLEGSHCDIAYSGGLAQRAGLIEDASELGVIIL